MKIIRPSHADWEEGKGYRKRIVVPELDLGIEGSFIQEVSFRPGVSVPMHYHKFTKEVFIPLDEAEFSIQGQDVALRPGEILICEPGDVHGNPVIRRAFNILVLKVGYVPDDTVWLG
ncbi:MAG: hypothetical protein QW520_02315 [Methanomassiliicoccales archaeon]